ncbi:A/G-specific adenine glycosylase [Lysinibacillus sp. 2017]|uniref:A/G-specific adenine glycosylase n=1 Tax=unclassified Lysinibacillus TaxID=2636778 RepID=UPI000D528CB2|nr:MULTISPECIES: A/G-specific adenine glycosylase [unclassified Lysinibacillus]AWE08735.1 A/G-specific adenine glycosylase [Lysinibacillus sp. 2017]TGN36058.1 A/G-specific adenine glycosylase [Lysinibacillus sp. S2017]
MNYQYTKQFRKALIDWFKQEQRDLPWRHTKEPYKIWVSEVMLQQTRVDTVIPYYNRFIEKYPTAENLAYASEEELLKMWEGLGYYSRARNLQAGVREVVETYGGKVPDNRVDISKLKGVGPYTAGAILSIAYGKPEHAVDGNVMRVLSRVLNIDADISLPKTKKIFEDAVTELIDLNNTSAFNQGLMELGAVICTPTSPKCLLCPVRDYCTAFQEGDPSTLPVKSKKVKTKSIEYDVFVVRDPSGRFLMEKRSSAGLLANMWQFIMVERLEGEDSLSKLEKQYGLVLDKQLAVPIVDFKHVFSHLKWQIESHLVDCKSEGTLPEDAAFLTKEQINLLPMPVPMLKIWDKLK